MPVRLTQAVAAAEQALKTAVDAGQAWLREHPHATAREIEVIALAAQGLGNAEIAERLGCAVDQVKDALRQVSRRWGCQGRAHVVATAFRIGYLSVEITKGVVR